VRCARLYVSDSKEIKGSACATAQLLHKLALARDLLRAAGGGAALAKYYGNVCARINVAVREPEKLYVRAAPAEREEDKSGHDDEEGAVSAAGGE
jgi:hypothetical protein